MLSRDVRRNGFRRDSRIGVGAFASVYRGTMPDGTAIAVKMLHQREELESFCSEAAKMHMCQMSFFC